MPRKNLKQIAQRYAGHLGYFNHRSRYRKVRLVLLFLALLIGGVAGGLYVNYWWTGPSGNTLTPPPIGNVAATGTAQSPAAPVEALNTAGGISQGHKPFATTCKACHLQRSPTDVVQNAVDKDGFDTKCQGCHNQPPYTFHQTTADQTKPADTVKISCIDCHHEHMGTGRMQPVTDASCIICHGNQEVMAAASKAGRKYHETMQPFLQDTSLVYYQPGGGKWLRPADGYTQVFQSFEVKHPTFQILRKNDDHTPQFTDTDTLKFGHQYHMNLKITTDNGQKLSCETCHKLDAAGAYMQKITYENSCVTCHEHRVQVFPLKKYPELTDFTVPHPTSASGVNSVRDFLRNIELQLANYYEMKKLAGQNMEEGSSAEFVRKYARVIKDLKGSISGTAQQETFRDTIPEDVINKIYLSDRDHYYPDGTSKPAAMERPWTEGCAECHAVAPATTANGVPKVTSPLIPDRWFVRAKFNHAAHANVATCEQCHTAARTSQRTSAILLPDRESCLKCHSAAGGVVSTCTTCHDYHNRAPADAAAALTPLRRMMLGAAPVAQDAFHP
jgi:hypothetical protein